MAKINLILFFAIVVMAVNNILWHFEVHVSFINLQKLYTQQDKLISTHQGYLSQYESVNSLLRIDKYAKKELGMISIGRIKKL